MAKQYKITMRHDKSTIERLGKIQYDTFSVKTKYFLYAFCLLCLLLGTGFIVQMEGAIQILLLAIGGIGIVNIGASGKYYANENIKIIEKNGGRYPCTTITFTDNDMKITESGVAHNSSNLSYGKIIRLVEDKDYLYLFVNKMAAYMLPLSEITGNQEPDTFKSFIEQKTGLRFSPPFSLMTWRFNLLDRIRHS